MNKATVKRAVAAKTVVSRTASRGTAPAAGEAKRARGRPLQRTSVGSEKILLAARRTFARLGFEATSVREISRSCGVDAALIAHHFGSKDDLWIAVVGQIAERVTALNAATAALKHTPLGARQRVERALGVLVDEVFAEPDIGMFFSTAATELGERSDFLLERLVRPYRDALTPLLAAAAKAKEIAIVDTDLTFFMLVNAISNTVSYGHLLSAFSSLPEHRDKYKKAVLATAMNMLGKEASIERAQK